MNKYLLLQDYMTRLLSGIHKKYSQLIDIPSEHEKIQMHRTITSWAVELELGDSLRQVQDLFNEWMESSDPDNENP